jgi:zinc transport system permease protein
VFENLLLQSFIALILVTISTSLIGVFVVWNRISYFGDALSHATMLGLGIGAAFNLNPNISLVIFAIFFAAVTLKNQQNQSLGKDATTMIASYLSIALAMVFSDIKSSDLDFSSFVFGDLLSAGTYEISALAILASVCAIFVTLAKNKIALINLNRDLAQISGIKVKFWELSFFVITAVATALSTQIVGIFLTTSLMIIPSAISRQLSNSINKMMLISLISGVACAFLSLVLAEKTNISATPLITIILCAALFFILIAQSLRKKFS